MGEQLLPIRYQVCKLCRWLHEFYFYKCISRHLTHSVIIEVELISLMDRNGIGTDATIAQHISTIQERKYAEKDGNQRFLPTKLGIALVEGYNR